MGTFTCLAIGILCIGVAFAAPEADLITDLPGLDYPLTFKQYSGYLDGGDGRKLHYWFVESQNDSLNDPVVLWLQGGPGCSSLYALLYENGPFKLDEAGENIIDNPFSWNRIANVLYLESPAGVGYSYREPDETTEDDDTTSKQNFLALQDFFDNKFPEFAKHDFYITGESYGGIYIPTLAVRILNETNDLNFKGYAIGNGYLEPKTNYNGPYYFYLYGHALRGKVQWANLMEACCNNVTDESCHFDDSDAECSDSIRTYLDNVGNLNPYNIYDDGDSMINYDLFQKEIQHMVHNKHIKAHFEKYILNTKRSDVSQGYDIWLNKAEVRKALHIPDSVQRWEMCGGPDYNSIYDSMKTQFEFIVPKIRGTIYNGDFDTVCSYLADEWFVERLGLEVLEEFNPWLWENHVGGYRKRYANLDFVTIRASGHMVPHDKPGPALKMLERFLKNE